MRTTRSRLRTCATIAATLLGTALALSGAAGVAASAATAPDRGPDPGSDPGHAPVVARLAAAGLASTIELDDCSGSLVRYPTSAGTDRAMLLTNGHCYEGGFLDDGEVLQDVASSRAGNLLDDRGETLARVRADRLLYATMTGTDVAMYRLTSTYDAIASATGARPLTLSTSRPTDGSDVAIPSSYWRTTYSCSVDGFVPTVREGQWTWHDSIRYAHPDDDCVTIGGTSGSPIVDDRTLQVVGINNTTNEDGRSCELNNPCEVGADGTTTQEEGQNYGQETYWFTTCLSAARTIDLDREGCLLTRP